MKKNMILYILFITKKYSREDSSLLFCSSFFDILSRWDHVCMVFMMIVFWSEFFYTIDRRYDSSEDYASDDFVHFFHTFFCDTFFFEMQIFFPEKHVV
jgi:hypothetical protein